MYKVSGSASGVSTYYAEVGAVPGTSNYPEHSLKLSQEIA